MFGLNGIEAEHAHPLLCMYLYKLFNAICLILSCGYLVCAKLFWQRYYYSSC